MIRITFTAAAVCALWLIASVPALAQDPTKPAADPVVDRLAGKASYFLERVGARDEQNALTELLEGSPLAKKVAAVQSLAEKSAQLQDKYGDFQEAEQIAAKRVGRDLVLLRYLFKCKNFPVVWYFTFYQDFSRTSAGSADQDNWILIAVRFDTQVETLGMP